MTNTPDKKHIKLWVEALRSGKYRQGKGRLRSGAEYCCLGVACDISRVGRWENGEYQAGSSAAALSLPRDVSDWLGIADANPFFGEFYLTTLNDRLDKSFPEIADLIEAEYLSA